ncbi:Peptidase M10 serralysin like protein [Caulobacter sp. AP07]|uniref:M10 family metallopeptidase C-terminal domain-containing protein n=1 Tax=Caulobacter sp. AP07 TaxID=1144304 RepID=UPI000271F724|nr:M10 family metallopeptidase C-terminal domain-containing protein [Caulobacter sp. AP07]EJL37352.1 Peptidase M10 serralysin like protein [Caulobacter sp. AP07]
MNGDQRGPVAPDNAGSLTITDAGAQLTRSDLNWSPGGILGTAATVTIGFRSTAPASLPTGVTDFVRFSAAQIAATELALQAWSDVANITFTRVGAGTTGEGAYTDSATLLFGGYTGGASGDAGLAFGPANASADSSAGDVWINASLATNTTPVMNRAGQFELVRDIARAIGLESPGDYPAGPLTYAANAAYNEDTLQYTVMSPFSANSAGGNLSGYAAAPQLDDIAAAQRLYGANLTTRTGDTVYGFNSTADRPWFSIANASATAVFAVWDAGGSDTLDFSGYGQQQVIDLRQGAFSNVGGATGNVAIALGAVIENVIGGSGSDTIYGNAADNRIATGGGADRIDGGLGVDTVVFSGARSAYSIFTFSDSVSVAGDGTPGVVSLTNVEFLQFSDQTVAFTATPTAIQNGDVTDNVINGGVINGGVNLSTLNGFGGDDVLNGQGGADILNGGAGNDTLHGGGGGDRLIGGLGDDALFGDDGVDSADYSTAPAGVTVSLAITGPQDTIAAGTDTLTSIEALGGSIYNDHLTGGVNADVLRGGGGSDILNGGAGDDQLFAGAPVETGGAPDLTKSSSLQATSFATAFSVDGAFDRAPSIFIANDITVPHATVRFTPSAAGREYTSFTVTAGATAVFNLRNITTFTPALKILRADGGQVAAFGGISSGEVASYTFADAGTYYLEVGDRASDGAGGFTVQPLTLTSRTYTLDVSISDHAVTPVTLVGSTLNGEDGNDVLTGSKGPDTLNGGAGDDRLISGGGGDTIDGGAGSNVAVFAGARSAFTITYGDTISVSRVDGVSTVTHVDRLEFSDITIKLGGAGAAHMVGTPGADTLTGTPDHDTIEGLAGDDILAGLGGDDTLEGGDGADTLRGGAGADNLYGGLGFDTAVYDDPAGGGGLLIDMVYATASTGDATGDVFVNIEQVIGTSGADSIRGTDGAETLSGLGGDDALVGRRGADALIGGDGYDTAYYYDFTGNAIIDMLNPGASKGEAAGDTFSSIERVIAVGNASFSFFGTAATETFVGSTANDFFVGRGGGDTFIGGAGNDTVTFDALPGGGGLTINLADSSLSTGDAANVTLIDIQIVVGSAGGDTFRGTSGADPDLQGAGGDDIFYGSAGADLMRGDAGTDTLYYASTAGVARTIADMYSGAANTGQAAGDVILSMERMIALDDGDFSFLGDGFANTLSGLGGADQFTGRGGNDVIDGGDGDDIAFFSGARAGYTITTTNGVTTVSGGSDGTDTLTHVERLQFSDAIVVLDAPPPVTGTPGPDTLNGTSSANIIDGLAGDDIIHGLGGDDTLYGNDGQDAVYGDAGADILYGDAGDDQLFGGTEGDTLFGGAGFDTANYQALPGGGGLLIDMLYGAYGTGEAQGDSFQSIERVIGTTGDDSIRGTNYAETLVGGDGDDQLIGKLGADTLIGGAGFDIALYFGTSFVPTVIDMLNPGLGTFEGAGDTYQGIEAVMGLGAFNFSFFGTTGTETLIGSDGADTFNGRGGGDTFIGGAGDDTINFNAPAGGGGLIIDLANSQLSTGDAFGVTMIGIETIVATSGADVMRGTTGVETLSGGDGDDDLSGAGGADDLIGGDGFDTASYHSTVGLARTVIDIRNSGLGTGEGAGDSFNSIERVMARDDGDFTFRGGIGSFYRILFVGAGGQDLFYAQGAKDTFDGGAGIDTVHFETLLPGSPANGGGLRIDMMSPTASNGVALGVTLLNIEGVVSTVGHDQVFGDNAANTLDGSLGNDELTGRGGADFLVGGDGFDIALYDTLPGGGGLTIDMLVPGIATGDALGDTFDSVERIQATSGADIVLGSVWGDQLFGGDGDDILAGRQGDDFLNGQNGFDTAYFDGAFADYAVTRQGEYLVVTSALEGTDVLLGIEALTFSDQTIASSWFL